MIRVSEIQLLLSVDKNNDKKTVTYHKIICTDETDDLLSVVLC